MEKDVSKVPSAASGSKRARAGGEERQEMRIPAGESFKSKLMISSESVRKQLCKPWENALTLKLMGRPHTLSFMQAKLKQKWNLIGQWQLTDLEDGYFVARFQLKADLEMALTGGPWIITNQYLVVQRWRPNFVPGEDQIQHMAVWVRLTKIPLECLDVNYLWRIGKMLGTMCKVDPITVTQARGRFARLCVEIDITKPIIGSVRADGKSIRVEYENLGVICFNCGRYGHTKELCSEGLEKGGIEVKTNNKAEEAGPSKSNPYGPWLLVSHPIALILEPLEEWVMASIVGLKALLESLIEPTIEKTGAGSIPLIWEVRIRNHGLDLVISMQEIS
ncbi:hypothetical protein ACOSQ2_021770 [Xanthoceras sorbifolium]